MGGCRGRSRGEKTLQKQREREGNRAEEEEVDNQTLRGLLFVERGEIEMQQWKKEKFESDRFSYIAHEALLESWNNPSAAAFSYCLCLIEVLGHEEHSGDPG